jgi:hypothetical protein
LLVISNYLLTSAIRVDRFAKPKRFVSLEKGSGLKALDEMDYHSLLGKSCNAIYNCKLLFLQIITFLQVGHNARAFITGIVDIRFSVKKA